MGRVVVIGAGVVGLALAETLARRGWEVVLCERHASIAQETSSRNSGVLHAGLYYPPRSLKARLCVEGRERLAIFLPAHGIAHRWIGKLIVACEPDELNALGDIDARAQAAGAVPLQHWTQADIAQRMPGVRAVAGLWSPGTGIVDVAALVARLRALAEQRGAIVLLGREVVEARLRATGPQIGVRSRSDPAVEWLDGDAVINAAGLGADRVAQLLDPPADLPRQHWVKGCWFSIRGAVPANALVYPVPSPQLLGLGTHLTLDLAGRARLGPDTEIVSDPSDLRVDPARAEAFARAARRFLPHLRAEHLSPDQAGIRPKLAVDGFADFHIVRRAQLAWPWIDLLGIESPGLTASLAIAAYTADLLG